VLYTREREREAETKAFMFHSQLVEEFSDTIHNVIKQLQRMYTQTNSTNPTVNLLLIYLSISFTIFTFHQ